MFKARVGSSFPYQGADLTNLKDIDLTLMLRSQFSRTHF